MIAHKEGGLSIVKTIASPENPVIKNIRRLQHRGGRRSGGRFVLEGVKLGGEALTTCGNDLAIEQALLSRPLVEREPGRALVARLESRGIPWAAVDARVFRRLSSLEAPEGLLLVARRAVRPLESLTGGLVVVATGIRDPGNLGAVARVAEAVDASALVTCRSSADPLQSKALRGSMGSLLRLPVVDGSEPRAALHCLRENGLRLVGCLARGGEDYRKADLRAPLALILGNESMGLEQPLLEATELLVSIPMKETVESLNVAVAAGLALYEALRQKTEGSREASTPQERTPPAPGSKP